MWKELKADIDAAMKNDPAARSRLEVFLTYPGVKALRAHRRAALLYRMGFKLFARMLSERTKRRTGIEIHPAAKIAAGVFIDHGAGVVIGETAEVETGVVIYQGVTLGGQVIKDNLSTASPVAKDYFENTNFELAIISASAFTPEIGFSCGSMVEADLLKMARQKAKTLYMMLDSSKIGKIMPHTFARLEDIDVLITDDNFPADMKELFSQKNIVVM